MGSESTSASGEEVDAMVDAPVDGPCPTKRKKTGIPKRVHKSEREKLKREHLNELFLDLANALEVVLQNNGKACVLNEATRLLKDLFNQVELLKKENASLLSESHYVTVEKKELKEEKCALESQIKDLQCELEARMAHANPDLSASPPEFQQPELTSHFPGDSYDLTAAVQRTLSQPSAVVVVPIHSELQACSTTNAAQLTSNPASYVRKPHARYPNPADSWHSQLLGGSISITRGNDRRHS